MNWTRAAEVSQVISTAATFCMFVIQSFPSLKEGDWISRLGIGFLIIAILSTAALHLIKRSAKPSLLADASTGIQSSASSAVEQFYRTYDNAMLVETEDLLRKDLQPYQGAERERVLVRLFAAFLILTAFDDVWAKIYRSQLVLLNALNTEGLDIDDIEILFYAPTKSALPEAYENFTFNQWFAFLRAHSLIAEQGTKVAISVRGREFLKYLIEAGRSQDQRRF